MYMYVRLNEKEISPALTIGALLDIAVADSYIDPPLCESYLYTFINGSAHGPVGLKKITGHCGSVCLVTTAM